MPEEFAAVDLLKARGLGDLLETADALATIAHINGSRHVTLMTVQLAMAVTVMMLENKDRIDKALQEAVENLRVGRRII